MAKSKKRKKPAAKASVTKAKNKSRVAAKSSAAKKKPAARPKAAAKRRRRAAPVATTFANIQTILDNAVQGRVFGAHGAFWRNVTRDQFVALTVEGIPFLVVGDPGNSHFVTAVTPVCPFGKNSVSGNPPVCPTGTYRQMPAGLAAMAKADVQTISDW